MKPSTDFDLFKVTEDHEYLREVVRAVAEDKIAARPSSWRRWPGSARPRP